MHNEFENGRSVFGWLHTADVKSLGKKEFLNKLHQSCLCPFKLQNPMHSFQLENMDLILFRFPAKMKINKMKFNFNFLITYYRH